MWPRRSLAGLLCGILFLLGAPLSAQDLGAILRGLSQPAQNQNGGSWNRNGYPSGGRQYDYIPNHSDYPYENDGQFPWRPLVEGIVDGLNKLPQQPDYRPDYRPPYRPLYPQYPQYPPQYPPQRPPATVKNNAPPPKVEKILKVLANAPPAIGDSLALTNAERELLQELAKDKAEKELKELETSLGDAAKDPAVQKELDKIKEKIADGKSVTEADIQKLTQAADASGKLPAGFDPKKADKLADQLIKWSDLRERLDAPQIPGGLIPSGTVDVISVPSLPKDDMVILPDGTVLIGTGGQGGLNVISMSCTDVFGVPIGIGEPVPDFNGDIAKRVKDGTLLLNPKENDAPIAYVVNNSNFTMKAGYSHHLPAGTTWVIQFDRSGDHGQAKYTLADGTYAFGGSDRGWELYKRQYRATIDNRQNEQVFYYNVNNTQQQVPAGSSAAHTSKYPLLVRFDRGDGSEAQKKSAASEELFQVAVDPSVGLWELYPGDTTSIEEESSLADARGRSPGKTDADGSKNSKTRAARLRSLLMETSSRD